MTTMTAPQLSEETKDRIQQILWEAQDYIKQDEFALAAKSFSQVLEHVNAPLPLLSRATCYMQLNELDKAVADLERILAMPNILIDPEIAPGCTTMHSAANTRLAGVYYSLGEYEKSTNCVNESKKIEEGKHKNSIFSDKHRAEAVEEVKTEGNKYFKNKDYVRAGALYKKALDMDPNNHILHSNQSQVLIQMNLLDLALFHATECVRLKPDWGKGYYRQGIILTKQKQYAKAIEVLRTAQELNKKSTNPDKAVDEAIKEAERLLKYQSLNGGVWIWIVAFLIAVVGAIVVWTSTQRDFN